MNTDAGVTGVCYGSLSQSESRVLGLLNYLVSERGFMGTHSQVVRLARLRNRSLALAVAVLAFVPIGLAAPAAADPPAASDLMGELVMPEGQGGDAWRTLSHQEAAAAEGVPRRTLQDIAEGQRNAVLDARDDKSEPPNVGIAAEYDYYTVDECRQHDPEEDNEQEVRLKNHFAFCLVSRPTYQFYQMFGPIRVLVGEYTFRLTMLGMGERGAQRMRFSVMLDDWGGWGRRDPQAPLGISLSCINYPNAECDTFGGGRQSTVAGWQFNGDASASFITSRSPGGGDVIHYDEDRVNYHDMRIVLTSSLGSTQFDQPFRCDAAVYASGGGCIFHEVDAVMHYHLTGHGVDSVAAHIKKAQDDPQNVYPGGIGTEIPGGKASGQPLTRLYKGMNAQAMVYYNANNRIARAACRTYDPNWGTPEMQCDEYPFRSTWEGANFTETFPGAKWKYSALMVDGEENGKAGSDLGVWYTQDHILAKDAFWVQINP
jgi:hypothetical protein